MNNRWYSLLTAVIIPTLFLSACATRKVAASELERALNPNVPATDVEQLVKGNTTFAFNLYQALRLLDGNMVYSPYSISLAFAMTYGGARGNTADQMARTLHYDLNEAQFHPAFNILDLDLAGRSSQATDAAGEDRFQLSIANSLWGQDGWRFLPDYLDLLAVNYGAGMRLVDFENAPENARKRINNWVSDQTKKRNRDIIPAGAINPLTRLVLANAIYFKATWEHEFDPNVTTKGPFTLLDGNTVDVDMMGFKSEEQLPYAAGDGWQAVALPYKGGLTDMIIIVPDSGKFESFEASLTAELYNQIVSALQQQGVHLSMPKFTFESYYPLRDILSGMGMQDAFDEQRADFSGIDGQHILYIGEALHKAFIAVDEKGTEAAASTIVIGMASSMPHGIFLNIDRPFFYVIRDSPSGSILFMGRVINPQ